MASDPPFTKFNRYSGGRMDSRRTDNSVTVPIDIQNAAITHAAMLLSDIDRSDLSQPSTADELFEQMNEFLKQAHMDEELVVPSKNSLRGFIQTTLDTALEKINADEAANVIDAGMAGALETEAISAIRDIGQPRHQREGNYPELDHKMENGTVALSDEGQTTFIRELQDFINEQYKKQRRIAPSLTKQPELLSEIIDNACETAYHHIVESVAREIEADVFTKLHNGIRQESMVLATPAELSGIFTDADQAKSPVNALIKESMPQELSRAHDDQFRQDVANQLHRNYVESLKQVLSVQSAETLEPET